MGKASKWFRGLLGLKKTDPSSSSSQPQPPKPPPKKKWSFVKSYREKDHQSLNRPVEKSHSRSGGGAAPGLAQPSDKDDPNKHAFAVAAATAAVAEAAVAAAQAAAEVVRLTSSGRAMSADAAATTTPATRMTSFGSAHVSGSGAVYGSREERAAVEIQSHFRAYLSRRALRALKALVKLQALVRGHLVRKHTADILKEMQAQMQAVLRAQARASGGRTQIFETLHKSNHMHFAGPDTPEKFEHIARAKRMKHCENLMFRRSGSKNSKIISNHECCRMDVKSWEHEKSCAKIGSRDDDRSDKILEIDTARPHIMLKRRNLFHSSHLSTGSDQYSHSFATSKESTVHQTVPSTSSCEGQCVRPLKFSHDVDDDLLCTAENSPQFNSALSKGGSAKRGPLTPTKSDGSRSCLSGYSDYPNYMSCTESSKAKMRSLSAPKQRPQYERSSSTKRFSAHGYSESRINPQRVSALYANFTSKAYPGSGRLDRLGLPIREEAVGFSGGHWHRF